MDKQLRGGRLLAMVSASIVLLCAGYFFVVAGRPQGGAGRSAQMPPEVAEQIGPERLARSEARLSDAGSGFRSRLMPTIVGGVLALAAGWLGSAPLLVFAFLVGFVPFAIGPYFLLVGGPATAIALGELSYLVAAYSIRSAKRAEITPPGPASA